MPVALWGLALPATGAMVQALCAWRDRRRFPPPGRLIDGLHVRCLGREPVAFFEAGIAASSANWGRAQAALEASAGSCSYDRRGFGWSAPARGDVTLRALTDDLRALLRAIPVRFPIVLIGHSFGSYIVRAYAHRFPEDVAGLVLIDPVASEELTQPGWRGRLRLERAIFFAHLARGLASIGLVRLGLWGLLRRGAGNAGPVLGLSPSLRRIAGEVAKLPPDVVAALRAQWSEPRFFERLAAYVRALPNCAAEIARCPLPAGLPVTVLSGAHQPPTILAAHRALATRHVVVNGSGHWIHLDHPQLVADEIRALGPATENS